MLFALSTKKYNLVNALLALIFCFESNKNKIENFFSRLRKKIIMVSLASVASTTSFALNPRQDDNLKIATYSVSK